MKTLVYSIFHKLGLEVRLLKSIEAEKNTKAYNPFQQLLELHKSNNCTIFDIGAYDGRISKEFLMKFPQAEIHAFEPFPESFEKLNKLKESQKGLIANNCAIADTIGHKDLHVNSFSPTNSLYESNSVNDYHNNLMKTQNIISVKTDTIDNYCKANAIQHIDILKMDIQGGELDALKGAEELLSKKKISYIYVEVEFVEMYKKQPLFIDIASYLKGYGFSLYNLYHSVIDSTGQLMWADALFVLNRNAN